MKKINIKKIVAATLAATMIALSCGTAYADSNVDMPASETNTTVSADAPDDVIVVYPELVDNTVISLDSGENTNGSATPYSYDVPKEMWDWDDGIYGTKHDEESGGMFYPLYRGYSTNTYYKFETDTKKLNINISLYAANNFENPRAFQIKMYRAKKGFLNNIFGTDWEYASFANMSFTPDKYNEGKKFSYSVPFSGLSDDYQYYFEFCNTSTGTSNASYYAIGGDFTISK